MLLLRFVLLVSVYLALLVTAPSFTTVDATVVLGPNDAPDDVPVPYDVTGDDAGVSVDDAYSNTTQNEEIVEVRFADPVPQQPQQFDVEDFDIASMEASEMTVEDIMPLVCDGLPRNVPGCLGVLPWMEYLRLHGSRFGLLNKRKRRFANTFGSNSFFSPPSYSPFFSPTSFGSFGSFGSNSFHPGTTGYGTPTVHPGISSPSGYRTPTPTPTVHPTSFPSKTFFPSTKKTSLNNTRILICPNPANQSAIYQLNPDSAGYPAAAIGAELAADPVLFACLLREVVLSTTPPVPFVEDFRLTANATCPFQQLRLYRFQSLVRGTQCFVLQNFGDFYFYRNCLAQFCRNCTTKPVQVPIYRYDSYGNRFIVGHKTQRQSENNQKICLTDYRATSLWAYCPALPLGLRIVRERILLPLACQCQEVRCDVAPSQHATANPYHQPQPQPHQPQPHPNPWPNTQPSFW